MKSVKYVLNKTLIHLVLTRSLFFSSKSITAFRKTISMSSSSYIPQVREILKMGDPRLLSIAEPIHEFNSFELDCLIADMQATMRSVNGAGLAAPQIGINLQLVIFGSNTANPRYPDRPIVPYTVLINPKITPLSDEMQEDWEGCLSVPGLRGMVPRWKAIRYTGFDPSGEIIEREVDDFHARVVQHECDHLMGKLYPMRIQDFSKFGFTSVLFPEIAANEADD